MTITKHGKDDQSISILENIQKRESLRKGITSMKYDIPSYTNTISSDYHKYDWSRHKALTSAIGHMAGKSFYTLIFNYLTLTSFEPEEKPKHSA